MHYNPLKMKYVYSINKYVLQLVNNIRRDKGEGCMNKKLIFRMVAIILSVVMVISEFTTHTYAATERTPRVCTPSK